MALDWTPEVRGNANAPGYVATDRIDEMANEAIRQSLLDRTPLERFADPDEIAGPAVFLASEAASYVTGSVLSVGGGWTSRYPGSSPTARCITLLAKTASGEPVVGEGEIF